jgi:hypothetical protein
VKPFAQSIKDFKEMNICLPHDFSNCAMMDCTSFHLDKHVFEPTVDALLQ